MSGSFSSAASSMCSFSLWMLALTGPSSTISGQMSMMKRPSEVPPAVESTGFPPVFACTAFLTASVSLPGLLREAGYVVSAKIPETLRGDFTLETYGSSNADGIDAIQIETESNLRTDTKKREVYIADLAYAISSLVARYADTFALVAFRNANFLPRLQRG